MHWLATGEKMSSDMRETLDPGQEYDHNLHFGQHILAELVMKHLKQLDLRDLDGFRRRKGTYVATSAAQGTATSLVVTGAVVEQGGVFAHGVVEGQVFAFVFHAVFDDGVEADVGKAGMAAGARIER